MDYNSKAEAKAYDKANYAAQTQAGVGTPPTSLDPASQKQQLAALCQFCDRLNTQRTRLRDIADAILGGEPEQVAGNASASNLPPVGGMTAEIIGVFENAGRMLRDIDHQIDRLQRVAS